MFERCQIAASAIAENEVLNNTTVTESLSELSTLKYTRLIVTDQSGLAIFDSKSEALGKYVFFPEVVEALNSFRSFSWQYHDGAMQSQAATPIVSYGVVTGCVYIMEQDPDEGAVILSLQRNILSVTIILEAAVLLFSIVFANTFSGRIRRMQTSMRIIRGGDYSHKVDMGGRDELTLLGDEFNELTERLQVSENKRRQFVSDASHELKTPLASIKLLSDSILQNDMDMETVREFVRDIGHEADRLNRMSGKLLSLSRIESQEDGECEIVNIAPTVDRVVRMLGQIAQGNGITIEFDLIQDSPVLILEDDLYQILFNLVENGIKYNCPGGRIIITLDRNEDNAVIVVKDTGVGIPADSIPHLFERFYRVDKARSRKSGGSGLGLSIVRNMLERNNGRIEVQSTPGSGSEFTVTFPVFDTEEDL